jgi:formylglycine-generating enzyme required for sulfatase activity
VSHFHGLPNNPVESVSWFDAVEFCNELSQKEGLPPYYVIRNSNQAIIDGGPGYRLPTEGEWEYACRAGTETRFSFGDDAGLLGEYGWYQSNSSGQTWPVGTKLANAWGLHDMHGNVWEWCWDWYDDSYYRNSPGVDPLGGSGATFRVIRGGSWGGDPQYCRSASRIRHAPEFRSSSLGFRVARGQSKF